MKFLNRAILILTFSTILLSSINNGNITEHRALAATTPPKYTNLFECMGDKMTQYMDAIIEAKANGTIPDNVRLLSPAFNMTSPEFNNIVSSINQTTLNSSYIYGFAGNLYHTHDNSLLTNYTANGVGTALSGKPIFITEAGCSNAPNQDSCQANLVNEYQQLLQSGADIQSLILFNPTGSNPDFQQHEMDPNSVCINGNCSTVGINFGTYFGQSDTSIANNFGYMLQIADASNFGSTLSTIQNSNAQVIVRIGVGSNSGGFTNPADYISYLSNLGNQANGKVVYAIAGPNEPDLEYWLFEECVDLFPNDALLLFQKCGGQINYDIRRYRGDVVGHNGEKPFNIDASLGQEILFEGQNEGTVLDKQLAKVLTSNLRIEAEYKHVDFEQISKRYTGSIDPNSPHYIENRIKLNKANTPNLIFNYRNRFESGEGVSQQAFCKSQSGESYTQCLKRLMGTTPDKTEPAGKTLGQDSDFQTLRFTGCIQRIGCNPFTETCFKADVLNAGEFCSTVDTKYNKPENCISVGQKINFAGKIIYEEPSALHSSAYTYNEYLRNSLVKTGTGKKEGFKDLYTSNQTDNTNVRELAEDTESQAQDSNKFAIKNNSTENTSLINPSSVNAIEANPPFDSTPTASCDGRIYAEMRNDGSSYAVAVWDTREKDGGGTCGSMADYAIKIDYILNGQVIGGCEIDQVRGRIPTYTENENGVIVSDLGLDGTPICAAPVTPDSLKPGEQLEAVVTIPHSNADDQDGCFKSAQCSTNGTKQLTTTPKPIDCRVCPSWAPASVCAQIIGTSIIDKEQCVDGNCATNVSLEGGGSSAAVPMHGPAGFSISNWLYETFGGWFGSATGLTGGKCENITGSRQDTDANNVPIFNPDGSAKLVDYPIGVKCRFNARHYNLYVYPSIPIPGDFGKRATNMEVNNVLSSVNQWTDKFFKPEPNKTSVKLKLNVPTSGFKAFTNTGEEVLADKKTSSFNTWTNGLLNFSAPEIEKNYLYVGCRSAADCTRNMHIEFKYFVQPQASGYCLTEKFLTMKQGDNNQIPRSLSDSHLCDTFPFIPGNDGKSRMAMDPEKLKMNQSAADAMQTELTQTFVLDQNQVEQKLATQIESVEKGTQNDRFTKVLNTTGQTHNQKNLEDRVVLLAQSLTEKQREQLNKELQRDIEIAITKNVQFMNPSNPDYLSPQLKYDLEKVRDRYIEKVLQLAS